MVSASMTSFQQWSSKSRAMMCSCLSGDERMANGLFAVGYSPFALQLLLHPHVFGEIIIGGVIAFVNLHAACTVVARIEHTLEKRKLQRPSGFRLRAAITARHGVVEPAVRRVGVDLDRVALVVTIEAVAQAPHVGERDHMVGLAENAENRTFDRGNDLVERFGIR